MTISSRASSLTPSLTLSIDSKAKAMKAEGIDVCSFGAGEPDFDTPDHIKRAAADAMRLGETKYTPTGGTRALQEAIIGYYEREFDASYDASGVMATAGGKQAIFNAVVSLLNAGDEVLIAKPYWVTFPEIVKFAGATPVLIDTEENGFQLTAEQVRRAATPRTRLIIINSPSNPSGRIIPPAEFQKIMETCAERGIYVVSDECYLRFVYAPSKVFSAASLAPELRARLCIAGSFSKTYAMTGWRIGYALAQPAWIKAMLLVQGHSTSNANSIAQHAAAVAMNSPQTCVREMLDEYARRREWLITALDDIPGLRCFAPEGAFYAFPDVRGCLNGDVKTSADFAEKLLNDEQVVVTDGAGFGADGYLRISYATSLERLKEGVERIRRVAEACAR
jgi:aspartate aminotransferase